MPELQQHDIVGNFLSSYATAQAQQQSQRDRAFQQQRVMRQDEMAQQQFDWQSQDRALEAAAEATSKELRLLKPGDEMGFNAALGRLVQQGHIKPEDASKYNVSMLPDLLAADKQWREAQAFKMEQQAAGQRGRLTEAQIAAANRSNRGEGGGGLANTVAQREQLAARYGLDPRTPAGQKFILTGTLPDDPAGKPMNDEQSKAFGFAKRVEDANKVLEDPGYQSSLLSGKENIAASIPLVGNSFVSSSYQMADQAVRDFINAQLRRESGAVISPSEFDNARQQYIPVYGDKPEVLERKRIARQRALENLYVSSGPRGTQRAQEVAPGAPPPPPAASAGAGAGNIPPPPPGIVVK